MTVPVNFRTSDEYIKSYDFIDTVTGRGVIVLYLSTTDSDEITLGYVTDSNDEYTSCGTGSVATWTQGTDKDFDITVNKPFTLQGNAIFNYSQAACDAGGGAVDAGVYIIVKLRKYSGSTETEVATVTGPETTNSVNGTTYTRVQLNTSVSLTTFNAGDILRITVLGYYQGGDVGSFGRYYHDPSNRNPVDSNSTTFVAYLPVVVQ